MDEKGILASYAKKQILKHFRDLSRLRFLFVWRSEPRKSEEGEIIAAQAVRLPPQWRDIVGCDVEIEVARPIWKELSKNEKRRLIWHEINHVAIVYDDSGLPKRDGANRIRILLRRHDLNVRTFLDEIKRFGPTSEHRVKGAILVNGLKDEE